MESSDSCRRKQQILWLRWKHTAINPSAIATHSLPGSSSLSASPLPVQLRNTCDLMDVGEFTWSSNRHLVLLLLNWWWCDCIPSDLIKKKQRVREMEGAETENGSAAFSSAGSLSGRHKSSDVTNAVNVLACLQYGLLEWAKPIGALLPVSSPPHLQGSSWEAI